MTLEECEEHCWRSERVLDMCLRLSALAALAGGECAQKQGTRCSGLRNPRESRHPTCCVDGVVVNGDFNSSTLFDPNCAPQANGWYGVVSQEVVKQDNARSLDFSTGRWPVERRHLLANPHHPLLSIGQQLEGPISCVALRWRRRCLPTLSPGPAALCRRAQ